MMIGFSQVVALGQQPQRGPESTPPSTGRPAAPPTSPPEMSVDEAIRAANDALDELPSATDSDIRSSLLDELDRLTEIVRNAEPSNPWLHFLYGRAYAATGRQGDAIDLLRKFVETREGRNEWRAHRILGDLFVDEFPRLANANYRKAAALNDHEPTVLLGLSRCAAKIGAYAEAVRLAEQTVAADGRQTIRYLNHLARLLVDGRQWTRARREAQAALRLADQAARNRPGERGPLQVLDAQYQLLVDVSTGLTNETPAASQPYLETARYLRARGDNAAMMYLFQILRVLEVGIERTAPNPPPELLQEYAQTLAQVGRRDQAIAEFERLLSLDPSNPVAAEWLRRLHEPQPEADPRPDP